MKNYSLFITLLVVGVIGVACNGRSTKNYVIEGKITDPKLDGRVVYMKDAFVDALFYDSAVVTHGRFYFKGELNGPVVRELLIEENDSDMFPVTLPLVLENGKLEVDLGERVYVGNTSLNKEMMEFLMAVDKFYDLDFTGKSVDYIKASFSNLLLEQIVKHSSNVVGRYIFEAYQKKLSEEQIRHAKKILGINQ